MPTTTHSQPGRRRRVSTPVLVGLALLACAPVGLLQRALGSDSGGQWLRHVFSGVLAGAVHHQTDTTGTLDFRQKLRIPALLPPRRDAAGRKVFDLTLRTGTREFLPGMRTPTWGVNGAYLGPTLRASRGDRVVVHVRNELPETTTLHWHGMHLPAVDDGGPHQPITSGTMWSPSWTIDQPAATLWYHPHLDGATAAQVYRGVAGMFILDDPRSRALALPHRYGVDDIPVILQDRRFLDDGSFDLAPSGISPTGILGDRMLVNGTYDPHVDVGRRLIRFRLLNASNARVYNIGFADGRAFSLVATDQGLVSAPRRLTRIQLSPGERAEVVAAFQPGERAVLRSFPPHLGTNGLVTGLVGGDDTFDLLQVRAAGTLAPSPALPRTLAAEPSAATNVARTRHFELGDDMRINGRRMDMRRVDTVVTAGTTEVWEVHNGDGLPHSFHVHGVGFRVVDYDGGRPPAALAGPKDTVYVPPQATVRLLIHFGNYADPRHPYMYHCHLLAHEDEGMMGQFVVVRPGQRAETPQGGMDGMPMGGMEMGFMD